VLSARAQRKAAANYARASTAVASALRVDPDALSGPPRGERWRIFGAMECGLHLTLALAESDHWTFDEATDRRLRRKRKRGGRILSRLLATHDGLVGAAHNAHGLGRRIAAQTRAAQPEDLGPDMTIRAQRSETFAYRSEILAAAAVERWPVAGRHRDVLVFVDSIKAPQPLPSGSSVDVEAALAATRVELEALALVFFEQLVEVEDLIRARIEQFSVPQALAVTERWSRWAPFWANLLADAPLSWRDMAAEHAPPTADAS
jgi:hypothetical protein